MNEAPIIVWFRSDLRLGDQPALRAACETRRPIVPVYVDSDDGEGDWPLGGAARVFLHHALHTLDDSLKRKGSQLVVRAGDSALAELRRLIAETGAAGVYWCKRYEPAAIARDDAVQTALTADGVEVRRFNGSLLYEPHEVATQQGRPYTVFTPYYKTCMKTPPLGGPHGAPRKGRLRAPERWPRSLTIDKLTLTPGLPWGDAVASHWPISEPGAKRRLSKLCDELVGDYESVRDRPDRDGTSRLSPYLRFGLLSPRQVWSAVAQARSATRSNAKRQGADAYLRQLIWREFAYHLLYHYPQTPTEPLRGTLDRFPWRDDRAALERWRAGRTGYPIVDAGMRQLWATGWMHNRVRMVVASFLVKDLLLHWSHGARWFWDTLVDADLANNTLGWQWAAGCGADAQPYFRIFNPTTQGQRFDPDGAYVKAWVPELRSLDAKTIHDPPPLGRPGGYPGPIVEHGAARAEALAAYEKCKAASALT